MKETGAYYGVEYSNIELGNLHSAALKLNTGRYCLEYIVRAKKYTRVYIPYFICNVVFEPLIRNNVAISLYNIDKNMEPVSLPELKDDEAFLYINYFGFKSLYIKELAKKVNNLIVDNCQSLFSAPLPGVDTFYALRKFAGVSDGAFLYCSAAMEEDVPNFDNSDSVVHLYLRTNIGAKAGYQDFIKSENELAEISLSKMSQASEQFLQTYDFAKNKAIRERNFLILHHYLGEHNTYKAIDLDNICGPLYYPMLVNDSSMRAKMIEKKVYVNIIWPGLDAALLPDSFENYLSVNLLPLPIDHRYNTSDMKRVAETFLNIFNK